MTAHAGLPARGTGAPGASAFAAGGLGRGGLGAPAGNAAGRGFSLFPLCRLCGEARSPRTSDAALGRLE